MSIQIQVVPKNLANWFKSLDSTLKTKLEWHLSIFSKLWDLFSWLHNENQAYNDKILFSPGPQAFSPGRRKASTCPNLFSPSRETFSPGSTMKSKLTMTNFCFLLALRRFLLAGEKQIQAQIRFILALRPFLLAPK